MIKAIKIELISALGGGEQFKNNLQTCCFVHEAHHPIPYGLTVRSSDCLNTVLEIILAGYK